MYICVQCSSIYACFSVVLICASSLCLLFCSATRDTIEMTKKMAEAGADAALVVTPCYYKNGMTVDALEKHYTKVSGYS